MIRRMAAPVLWLLGSVVAAQVVTVNDAGDTSNPCATTGTGTCTLRDAFTWANTQIESTIVFAIPDAGVHTIAPASPLPTITARVTIEGYSQSGASPNTNPPEQGTNAVLLIEIDGTGTGSAFDSRVLGLSGAGADGSVIRGLVINRGNAGIRVDGVADAVIEGCFIGTDPSGTVAHGNAEAGVLITSNATNTTVGGLTAATRNLISANGIDGINVGADNGQGGSGHFIAGNLIGTDATGLAALPGTQTGIELTGSYSNVRVGGGSPAQRNLISGNPAGGVRRIPGPPPSSRATSSARTSRGRCRSATVSTASASRARRTPSEARRAARETSSRPAGPMASRSRPTAPRCSGIRSDSASWRPVTSVTPSGESSSTATTRPSAA